MYLSYLFSQHKISRDHAINKALLDDGHETKGVSNTKRLRVTIN